MYIDVVETKLFGCYL